MSDDPTGTQSGEPGEPGASDEGAGGLSPHEIAAARRKLRLGFEPDEADESESVAAPAPPPLPPAASAPAAPLEPPHEPAAPSAPLEPPAPEPDPQPLIVANCSGFYGDRLSAAREMVEGGPIDVLTGDWLAELTMLILAKSRLKDPDLGFATTFLTQMEQVLGTCLAEGIVVVSNAGGLNPAGCADALHQLASRLGLSPRIAYVEGDDLMPLLDELRARGIELRNLDTGESLEAVGIEPMTANAYLGAWGIADALDRGADVVITGRVTDAAVVVGPAASRFGWARTDWDPLAGAVTAGHLIECGAQCTGGNFAFFGEVPELERPGFPIAEIHHDGSFVVTKHPGTGGLVSVDTVTAQLLYEVQGLGYHNPDVIVAFDSLRVDQDGPDRVRVSGAVGLPAPDSVKVAVNYPAGYRNSMTFVLTGLDIEAKAELAERTLWSLVPGGRDGVEAADVHLRRSDRDDPPTNEDAMAELRITVMDRDREKVGRAFSSAAIEMVLSSYPGLFTTSPPGDASSFGVYWPALIPDDIPVHEVVLDGERTTIAPLDPGERGELNADDAFTYGLVSWNAAAGPAPASDRGGLSESLVALLKTPPPPNDATFRTPLGAVFGARSGDKGGNANLGVWARRDDAYVWLHQFLTVDRLRQLMPAETEGLDVRRFELPNIRAVNFVIMGLLGRGVAASTRLDPQGKGLGEYLRAKVVDLPTRLVDDAPPPPLENLPPPPGAGG
jgi:Acyclic terpene utilisation family protein AtuA